MNNNWDNYTTARDGSHHLIDGQPAYESRFHEVWKFHTPGLAPVRDDSGAYHIDITGHPAYKQRYSQTFGFYEGRAAVHDKEGWHHILPNGERIYANRYEWCGNFQEGRCVVRHFGGLYSHINLDGHPAYKQQYQYAGDYREGFAVVQRHDGLHSHINKSGQLMHGIWFKDLDVFHKGYARACDHQGWHHIDVNGKAIYNHRFKSIEPFYNKQARVEDFDGSLLVIDEYGETIVEIRKSPINSLERVSEDMVGFWKTQTIRAAVQLGIFDLLPACEAELETKLGLDVSSYRRLLRALHELELVYHGTDDQWFPTERGVLLRKDHPISMHQAALLWGAEHYEAWAGLADALHLGRSLFDEAYGKPFFEWLADHPAELEVYQAAMHSYSQNDYAHLCEVVDFSKHQVLLDAGGGRGQLLFSIMEAYPELKGILMDRSEVATNVDVPSDLKSRCSIVPGDLFKPWPVEADAIMLARVLHDWPDEMARKILQHARETIRDRGRLYILEMVLDESSGLGGLLDLNMLVMTGGLERGLNQFKGLLETAGFILCERIKLPSVTSVLVAETRLS